MRIFRQLFRQKSHIGTSAPAQIIRREENHEWLAPILEDVKRLELPDHDQLDHAFQGYLDELHAPFEAHDEAIETLVLEAREIVQRVLEIAPDLFDKAMRRSPLDNAYTPIIEGEKQ